MHPSPDELLEMLSEAKRLEWGSAEQLKQLEQLRVCCPAYVPGLLLSSRALLWGKDDLADPASFFTEVEHLLLRALDASDRTPEALNGMARFQSVVRDAPEQAEALYREAAMKAMSALEEAWAGLIEALGEQGKTEDAARTATLASKLFPGSHPLAEARGFAGLKD